MRNFLTTIVLVLAVSLSAHAQSIVGKWKTIDDSTGKEKSIVEIYEKGQLKDGQLKEIASRLDKDDNPVIMLIKQKK